MSETQELLVIDTETTGMEPENGDTVLELAGSVVYYLPDVGRARPYASWHTLVRYDGDISPQAKAVHHITESMVRSEHLPVRSVALSQLEQMCIKGYIPVAHNVAFDSKFLPELGKRWICTYRCALHIWPEAPGHSNQVLRYWLGLEPELPVGLAPHRALYDAIVTRGILMEMLETHTPEELVKMTNEPVLLNKVRFGKHVGLLWKDVPYDYLKWVVRQSDMDADVLHTARYYINH